MYAITQATTSYMEAFAGFVSQFIAWGQHIFFSLLLINFVWLGLNYAFDKTSIVEGFSDFLKRFAIMGFFYALLCNPSWMESLLNSATAMGFNLSHVIIDPSSLISIGIGLANKIIQPVSHTGILDLDFGVIFAMIVYVGIIFCFISVAIELAITLIITCALVCISPLFFGFAALSATHQIARQTLDVVIANCIKLLGIYLCVAAGLSTINYVESIVPSTAGTLDDYCWVLACVVLFWQISKQLPPQLARIISGGLRENQHADAAAIALSAVGMASSFSHHIKSLKQLVQSKNASNLSYASHLSGATNSHAHNALTHAVGLEKNNTLNSHQNVLPNAHHLRNPAND